MFPKVMQHRITPVGGNVYNHKHKYLFWIIDQQRKVDGIIYLFTLASQSQLTFACEEIYTDLNIILFGFV